MIETSFEYPKNIGVLNYDYVEMDDSSENDCLLNNTNKNPYGTKQQNEKTLFEKFKLFFQKIYIKIINFIYQ